MCAIKKNDIIENHIIFLDTSILESENYFEGRNINILFELAKQNLVQLKLTDIVYREVLNRIDNHSVKAVNLFKKQKLNFDKEARILRNAEVLKSHFEKIDFKELKEKARQEILEKFHKTINEFKIEIIDSSNANIKEVLDDYFATNPPFKDGLKKSEFPDALSINSIKIWCTENSKTVIHLSTDKDFDNYISDLIDCKQTLSSLLELLFKENSNVQFEFITAIYQKSINDILHSIESELYEDFSSLAYSEIENDAWFEDVEVDFYDVNEINIVTSTINEVEDKSFSYEIETNIIFRVQANYTDLSTAFYDKEDGIWFGEERRSEIKKYCVNTLVYADFELEENKVDGSFIEITDFEFRNIDEL